MKQWPPDNWDGIDWRILKAMRQRFIGGTAGAVDYWTSPTHLVSYDLTFAQRIGWKWDYVLADLAGLGWTPPPGAAMDWGCGTGIAGRQFLKHFPQAGIDSLICHDRSKAAADFAAGRARESCPGVRVTCQWHGPVRSQTVLLSHVLAELTPSQLDGLLTDLLSATTVIWIEPGTHEISHALIAARQRLKQHFQIVAPCTHQGDCGLLTAGNERHWCHQFAPSPREASTDGNWARFSQIAGIDLRALPLSWLVLDKRPAPVLPAGTVRTLGRARMYKAYALLFACDSSGVRDRRFLKRHSGEFFRKIRKDELHSLQTFEFKDDDILGTKG